MFSKIKSWAEALLLPNKVQETLISSDEDDDIDCPVIAEDRIKDLEVSNATKKCNINRPIEKTSKNSEEHMSPVVSNQQANELLPISNDDDEALQEIMAYIEGDDEDSGDLITAQNRGEEQEERTKVKKRKRSASNDQASENFEEYIAPVVNNNFDQALQELMATIEEADKDGSCLIATEDRKEDQEKPSKAKKLKLTLDEQVSRVTAENFVPVANKNQINELLIISNDTDGTPQEITTSNNSLVVPENQTKNQDVSEKQSIQSSSPYTENNFVPIFNDQQTNGLLIIPNAADEVLQEIMAANEKADEHSGCLIIAEDQIEERVQPKKMKKRRLSVSEEQNSKNFEKIIALIINNNSDEALEEPMAANEKADEDGDCLIIAEDRIDDQQEPSKAKKQKLHTSDERANRDTAEDIVLVANNNQRNELITISNDADGTPQEITTPNNSLVVPENQTKNQDVSEKQCIQPSSPYTKENFVPIFNDQLTNGLLIIPNDADEALQKVTATEEDANEDSRRFIIAEDPIVDQDEPPKAKNQELPTSYEQATRDTQEDIVPVTSNNRTNKLLTISNDADETPQEIMTSNEEADKDSGCLVIAEDRIEEREKPTKIKKRRLSVSDEHNTKNIEEYISPIINNNSDQALQEPMAANEKADEDGDCLIIAEDRIDDQQEPSKAKKKKLHTSDEQASGDTEEDIVLVANNNQINELITISNDADGTPQETTTPSNSLVGTEHETENQDASEKRSTQPSSPYTKEIFFPIFNDQQRNQMLKIPNVAHEALQEIMASKEEVDEEDRCLIIAEDPKEEKDEPSKAKKQELPTSDEQANRDAQENIVPVANNNRTNKLLTISNYVVETPQEPIQPKASCEQSSKNNQKNSDMLVNHKQSNEVLRIPKQTDEVTQGTVVTVKENDCVCIGEDQTGDGLMPLKAKKRKLNTADEQSSKQVEENIAPITNNKQTNEVQTIHNDVDKALQKNLATIEKDDEIRREPIEGKKLKLNASNKQTNKKTKVIDTRQTTKEPKLVSKYSPPVPFDKSVPTLTAIPNSNACRSIGPATVEQKINDQSRLPNVNISEVQISEKTNTNLQPIKKFCESQDRNRTANINIPDLFDMEVGNQNPNVILPHSEVTTNTTFEPQVSSNIHGLVGFGKNINKPSPLNNDSQNQGNDIKANDIAQVQKHNAVLFLPSDGQIISTMHAYSRQPHMGANPSEYSGYQKSGQMNCNFISGLTSHTRTAHNTIIPAYRSEMSYTHGMASINHSAHIGSSSQTRGLLNSYATVNCAMSQTNQLNQHKSSFDNKKPSAKVEANGKRGKKLTACSNTYNVNTMGNYVCRDKTITKRQAFTSKSAMNNKRYPKTNPKTSLVIPGIPFNAQCILPMLNTMTPTTSVMKSSNALVPANSNSSNPKLFMSSTYTSKNTTHNIVNTDYLSKTTLNTHVQKTDSIDPSVLAVLSKEQLEAIMDKVKIPNNPPMKTKRLDIETYNNRANNMKLNCNGHTKEVVDKKSKDVVETGKLKTARDHLANLCTKERLNKEYIERLIDIFAELYPLNEIKINETSNGKTSSLGVFFNFQLTYSQLVCVLLMSNNHTDSANELKNSIYHLLNDGVNPDMKYKCHKCHNVAIYSPFRLYYKKDDDLEKINKNDEECEVCRSFRKIYVNVLKKYIKIPKRNEDKEVNHNSARNGIIDDMKELLSLIINNVTLNFKTVKLDHHEHKRKTKPSVKNTVDDNYFVKIPLSKLHKSTVKKYKLNNTISTTATTSLNAEQNNNNVVTNTNDNNDKNSQMCCEVKKVMSPITAIKIDAKPCSKNTVSNYNDNNVQEAHKVSKNIKTKTLSRTANVSERADVKINETIKKKKINSVVNRDSETKAAEVKNNEINNNAHQRLSESKPNGTPKFNKTDGINSYTCKLCSTNYKNKSDYQNHMHIEHGKIVILLNCEYNKVNNNNKKANRELRKETTTESLSRTNKTIVNSDSNSTNSHINKEIQKYLHATASVKNEGNGKRNTNKVSDKRDGASKPADKDCNVSDYKAKQTTKKASDFGHQMETCNSNKKVTDTAKIELREETTREYLSKTNKTVVNSDNKSTNSHTNKEIQKYIHATTSVKNEGNSKRDKNEVSDKRDGASKPIDKDCNVSNYKTKQTTKKASDFGRQKDNCNSNKKVTDTAYIGQSLLTKPKKNSVGKIHIAYIHTCPHCSVLFMKYGNFMRHLKENHGIKVEKIPDNCRLRVCTFCGKEMMPDSYNDHIKRKHNDMYSRKQDDARDEFSV